MQLSALPSLPPSAVTPLPAAEVPEIVWTAVPARKDSRATISHTSAAQPALDGYKATPKSQDKLLKFLLFSKLQAEALSLDFAGLNVIENKDTGRHIRVPLKVNAQKLSASPVVIAKIQTSLQQQGVDLTNLRFNLELVTSDRSITGLKRGLYLTYSEGTSNSRHFIQLSEKNLVDISKMHLDRPKADGAFMLHADEVYTAAMRAQGHPELTALKSGKNGAHIADPVIAAISPDQLTTLESLLATKLGLDPEKVGRTVFKFDHRKLTGLGMLAKLAWGDLSYYEARKRIQSYKC